jgi:hypothetical protein
MAISVGMVATNLRDKDSQEGIYSVPPVIHYMIKRAETMKVIEPFSFFNMEYILISKRYKLLCNKCPSDNGDAHIQQREEELQKKKSRYSDMFLVIAALTPSRQHQKSNIFKSDTSNKGTVHERCHARSYILGFHMKKSLRS